MDNPAKVNNLEITLWAFKNVQNITGSTIKTFQLKNQHKPSCKSEFPFYCCCCCCYCYYCCCWYYIEYFLSVFLSSFIKIFEDLWKWFEFIHYSILVNNTCVSTLSLYAHVIIIKMGVSCIYAYSLFVWNNRDTRGLYFSNFSLEKYILKCKYSIILKNVLAVN